jgi:DNA-binding transcriptional ArsR family regulator
VNANVFQALADPSRLQLVEALFAGEQPVTDLLTRVDIQQSGVSRHLRILERAGLVQMRAQGTRHLYSLRPEPFGDLERWAAQYRRVWEARLDAFGAALERKQHGRPARRPRRTTP